jgi:putative transposase
VLRTFRYPLRPTRAQEATLELCLVACQQLYNGALEHRREAWRRQRKNVTLNEQHKELTQLRAHDPEWALIPRQVELSALGRLDFAFKSFFRRVKDGQSPGYPRFRSRERYNSFSVIYGNGNSRIAGNLVVLPKLGPVRFHKYRELRGTPKVVRIRRDAWGWSVHVVCEIGEAPTKASVRTAIGVDLGIEAFATLSNGERVENPHFGRAEQETLARRQAALARKRRGSNGRREAKRLVSCSYERIRNLRRDFARKLACILYARFDLIAHEDLQIASMARTSFSKSINDAAWGQFLRALQSKAESAGKWCVPVDPRWTSQTCSACGTVVKKQLRQREHRCGCGFVAHRDHNAALNVLARGLRAGQLTEAPGGAGPMFSTLSKPDGVSS